MLSVWVFWRCLFGGVAFVVVIFFGVVCLRFLCWLSGALQFAAAAVDTAAGICCLPLCCCCNLLLQFAAAIYMLLQFVVAVATADAICCCNLLLQFASAAICYRCNFLPL